MIEKSKPEDQKVSSLAIKNFLHATEQEEIEMHNFMILKNNKAIAEGSWRPYDSHQKQFLFSVTKTFTATAIGFAYYEDLLSLEDTIINFFPEYNNLNIDSKMGSMTIKNLLTMTSGYIENISGSTVWSQKEESWVKEFLTLPLTFNPGEKFVYNSGSSHILSAIISKVTNKSLANYLQARLFNHLKINDVTWDVDPEGNNTGGWGLRLKIEDLAKFGQFYLQKGKWENKQLLPEEWFHKATTFQISTAEENDEIDKKQGYGYQLWLIRNEGYMALGMFGQLCVILPQKNAVIAITSGTSKVQSLLNILWEHLYPYLDYYKVTDNFESQQMLDNYLKDLSLFPDLPDYIPILANNISGKKYKMQRNKEEISSVQFNFTKNIKNSCLFEMVNAYGTQHHIKCGIGYWHEGKTTMPGGILHHMQQPNQLLVRARGFWNGEKHFVMKWVYIEMPFIDTVSCYFEEDKIIFKREVNVNGDITELPTIIGEFNHELP